MLSNGVKPDRALWEPLISATIQSANSTAAISGNEDSRLIGGPNR